MNKFAYLHSHGAWGTCTDDCGWYEVRRKAEQGEEKKDATIVVEALVCEWHWTIHDPVSPDIKRDKKDSAGQVIVQDYCTEVCRPSLVPTTLEMRYHESEDYKREMAEDAEEEE